MQFFYKDYSRKTNDRLNVFDKDFCVPLEEEQRRLKKVCLIKLIAMILFKRDVCDNAMQLQAEIDSLQKEYYELQAKKIDIKKLANQLLDAYSNEFARVSFSDDM